MQEKLHWDQNTGPTSWFNSYILEHRKAVILVKLKCTLESTKAHHSVSRSQWQVSEPFTEIKEELLMGIAIELVSSSTIRLVFLNNWRVPFNATSAKNHFGLEVIQDSCSFDAISTRTSSSWLENENGWSVGRSVGQRKAGNTQRGPGQTSIWPLSHWST